MPILNASPQNINYGALDLSLPPLETQQDVIGGHVALVMLMTERGPVEKTRVSGGDVLKLYGFGSFDRNKGFFNHSTRLTEIVAGSGVAVKRIIPEDNDTIANITLYLDIIKDSVKVYKRNLDGSFYIDGNGEKVEDKEIEGYKIKLVSETVEEDQNTDMGVRVSKPGNMTNTNGDTSVMYPVMELRAKYKGSFYNNIGFSFNLPTEENADLFNKDKLLNLPYEVSMYHRENSNSTGSYVRSLYNTVKGTFFLKKDARDIVTRRKVDLVSVLENWYNLDNPLINTVHPHIEKPVLYYSNIEMINKLLLETEKEFINTDITTQDGTIVNSSEWLDFTLEDDVDSQYGLTNPFTCKSIKKVPAFSYSLDDSVVSYADNMREVMFNKATPIYLGSGKDGTLSEEEYEKGVVKYMAEYLDENSRVMDSAYNLENVLYDSGFTINTKLHLVNFISVRKDTFLVLSTREARLKEKYSDMVEERSIGLMLDARVKLAPESVFYNTPVVRSLVLVGNGIDTKDPNQDRASLALHIAGKMSTLCGGVKWDRNKMFDLGKKNVITDFKDIQPDFIPKGVKPDLWNIGLVWPQQFDEKRFFFPAMQTSYPYDSSVLNNPFLAMALTTTNKIADKAWRTFSGSSELTTLEFIEEVDNFLYKELDKKFDDVVKATANTVITDENAELGYKWDVVSKLYGSVMKTVMTHTIEAHRKDEL